MQSLRNIFKAVIKNIGIESGAALNVLRRKWPQIVGQPVSVHTYPDTVRNKILTVIVDTPQWMHHLSFFKKDILAVNGFNEDFMGWGDEDSELACRFFKFGLIKKVHSSMAICFHLWHPTNKKKNVMNKQLLLAAIASKDYFCKNGIVKQN